MNLIVQTITTRSTAWLSPFIVLGVAHCAGLYIPLHSSESFTFIQMCIEYYVKFYSDRCFGRSTATTTAATWPLSLASQPLRLPPSSLLSIAGWTGRADKSPFRLGRPIVFFIARFSPLPLVTTSQALLLVHHDPSLYVRGPSLHS